MLGRREHDLSTSSHEVCIAGKTVSKMLMVPQEVRQLDSICLARSLVSGFVALLVPFFSCRTFRARLLRALFFVLVLVLTFRPLN